MQIIYELFVLLFCWNSIDGDVFFGCGKLVKFERSVALGNWLFHANVNGKIVFRNQGAKGWAVAVVLFWLFADMIRTLVPQMQAFDYASYTDEVGIEWRKWLRSFETIIRASHIDDEGFITPLHEPSVQQLFDSLPELPELDMSGPLCRIWLASMKPKRSWMVFSCPKENQRTNVVCFVRGNKRQVKISMRSRLDWGSKRNVDVLVTEWTRTPRTKSSRPSNQQLYATIYCSVVMWALKKSWVWLSFLKRSLNKRSRLPVEMQWNHTFSDANKVDITPSFGKDKL